MYCENCGTQIADEAVICPMCGCQTQNLTETENVSEIDEKKRNRLLGISLFFPIAGLIIGISRLSKKQYKFGTECLIYSAVGILIDSICIFIFW